MPAPNVSLRCPVEPSWTGGEIAALPAGRSGRRLADVRAGLGAAASAWPLLVADSADPVSVALARAARVVVTTVGPYRAQGLALVEACPRRAPTMRT